MYRWVSSARLERVIGGRLLRLRGGFSMVSVVVSMSILVVVGFFVGRKEVGGYWRKVLRVVVGVLERVRGKFGRRLDDGGVWGVGEDCGDEVVVKGGKGFRRRLKLEKAMRAAEEMFVLKRERREIIVGGDGGSGEGDSDVGRGVRMDVVRDGRNKTSWKKRVLKVAEKINGRAAAAGFVLCALRESFEPGHPSLARQIEQVMKPIAMHTPQLIAAVYAQVIDILT